MVSGLSTSPDDFSRISSGEARPIVIFENEVFDLLSFLKAIYIELREFYKRIRRLLLEVDAQAEALEAAGVHFDAVVSIEISLSSTFNTSTIISFTKSR